MGIRKRVSAAKEQLDEIPEAPVAITGKDGKAARLIAEGILNLEKWRNIDALDCFQKALAALQGK